MVFFVWKAGSFGHFPGLIRLGFSLGLRYLPAPRSRVELIYFSRENRFCAFEWHLSGQLRVSDS